MKLLTDALGPVTDESQPSFLPFPSIVRRREPARSCSMSPQAMLSGVTHQCRNCGHHLCRRPLTADEFIACSVCHSLDVEPLQVFDQPAPGPFHDTTVVFRVAGSRNDAAGLIKTLDLLFKDDGLAEIVAIESGNQLQQRAGGQ
ncbi:hypothetical protein HWE02_14210 [Pseudomonas oryzihabitans]|uniref:hypothetical protein n=2 Tax=Pseudomonas oryzihabitans TaxID=47885 RepID=UPI001F522402|nr:hypothetical protein [Pseudomonas oryzihabitans]MCI1010416.1 hypothetical protein [Pseudomonas oryzihabitans]